MLFFSFLFFKEGVYKLGDSKCQRSIALENASYMFCISLAARSEKQGLSYLINPMQLKEIQYGYYWKI